MASIPGGQFTFFAANRPVNVVVTPDGQTLPLPIAGDFNLGVVPSAPGSLSLPPGYQGVALLADGGHSVDLANGDYGVSVIGNGGATIRAGSGNDTIVGGGGGDLVSSG